MRKAKITTWLFIEKIIRLSPTPNVRNFLIRKFGGKIERDVFIHDTIFQNVYVNGFKNLIAESKVTIQPGCIVDLADKVVIRKMATISQGVIICTHSNPGKKLNKPLARIFPPTYQSVEFGVGCWVGAGSIIMPGIKIGEMSVIGAGSIVLHDVEPRTVVAGNPATKIRKIHSIDLL